MRGRSLLKEPSCPSLCAFCAHRLGQARRPASHIQRRFLQTSRSVGKPPAEAAAVREREDAPSTSPSWGRPAALGPQRLAGLGPTAGLGPQNTWGGMAGGFGGGIPGGIPARPGMGGGIPPPQTPRPSGASTADELLPHERRAREMLMEQENARKAEQKKLDDIEPRQRPTFRIHGRGPESHRSGRPEPKIKTEAERIEEAEREKARRDAIALWTRKKEDQEHLAKVAAGETTGFRVRRAYSIPLSERDGRTSNEGVQGTRQEERQTMEAPAVRRTNPRFDSPREPSSFSQNANTSNDWGQLKRRAMPESMGGTKSTEQAYREPSGALPIRRLQGESSARLYQEERAQREEETRSGRYTPIGALGVNRTFGLGTGRAPAPENTSRTNHDRPAPLGSRSVPLQQSPSRDDDATASFRPMAPAASENESQMKSRFEKTKPAKEEKEEEEEEEEEARSRPKRRERTRKGQDNDRHAVEAMARGKDKDKAKRRQGFVRTEADDRADEEAAERTEAKRLRKLERKAAREAKKEAATPILLPEYISVSNLAVALKVRLEDFDTKMEELGFKEMGHDYILNAETSGLIAQEYNFEPIIDHGDAEDLKAREPAPDPSILPQRPPVVTIMGHVDHGKTTLLDYLRKSSVAAGEHGGITQHIGAFSVPMPSGKVITFLDTPGHAAFLSMRQRGANVTDIVILVVAADDSVKPQTIEAINHAKAAKVPIIVAINKIDKEDSDIDRVKQDLARHGVEIEDFGGDTQVVCVSGKTGKGMDELEEAAVTLSEILDMRAERDGPAEGWVIEASIKSMGKVATVLVRRGTMRPGDVIVAGQTWARIRGLRNEAGIEIDEAGPGTPVEIDGWREQPLAGDEVLEAVDEQQAKSVVDLRLEKEERDRLAEDMEAINENRKAEQDKREREKAEAAAAAAAAEADEDLPETARLNKPTGPKQIYFIIKGDVSGSVEAVIDYISGIGNNEVQPHILRSGVGQLSEFDVEHAAAAKGHLINFNTAVEPHIAQLADQNKVSILDHNIIYRLVDDVKKELNKHLPPLITQKVMGEAEIAQIFSINVKGRQQKPFAGCKVRNGTISKTAKVRVLRGGNKIYDGTLISLKNVKKDVPEMKKGGECGIGFDDWYDFQLGDQVQSYEEIHEKRYL